MLHVGTLPNANNKVCSNVRDLLARLHKLSAIPINSAKQGVSVLKMIREEAYEDINQIQHEHMILLAIDWIIANRKVETNTEWTWNPRQSGDHTEPDLMGKMNGCVIVSAEITTSKKPVGTIDSRMAKTLEKLSRLDGKKYYFVRNEVMAKRAKTKIVKSLWAIEVVTLHGVEDNCLGTEIGGNSTAEKSRLVSPALPRTQNASKRSILDVIAEAPGHVLFKNADEVDAYLREERSSWER
ncbi:MAG: hypothetical protein WCT04_12245 [Planctomycetota bacterium]